MRATPHPWLLSLSMVALVPSMASAEFRYLAVGDVRQSYNSHVYDLDLAVDPTENHGLVTEIEPGIRLYAGQRRTLLSMRYSFLGQMIYILQQNEPVMGYGNRLQLNYTYRASPRTELGIMNLFEQGTENVTAPPTINEAGVPRAARMVTAGSVVTETLRVGVAHLVAPRWNIRPQLSVEVYQPYGDPPSDDIPTANPIYSLGLSFRVAWNWFQRSALVLDLSGSALFDNPDPAAFIPDQFDVNNNRISLQHERDGLPDYWRTLLGGAMLAWRWQLTDFLDAEIGGGVQYYTRQYFCDIRQNPACPPTFVDYEGGVAPLAEGFIRYRYGARLACTTPSKTGCSRGWARSGISAPRPAAWRTPSTVRCPTPPSRSPASSWPPTGCGAASPSGSAIASTGSWTGRRS
jgi:hypothetical protein